MKLLGSTNFLIHSGLISQRKHYSMAMIDEIIFNFTLFDITCSNITQA